jgi:hypothetical protein
LENADEAKQDSEFPTFSRSFLFFSSLFYFPFFFCNRHAGLDVAESRLQQARGGVQRAQAGLEGLDMYFVLCTFGNRRKRELVTLLGLKVRSARLGIPSSANALPAIGEPKRVGGTLGSFGGTVPVKLLHNHARSLQHLARVHSECTV